MKEPFPRNSVHCGGRDTGLGGSIAGHWLAWERWCHCHIWDSWWSLGWASWIALAESLLLFSMRRRWEVFTLGYSLGCANHVTLFVVVPMQKVYEFTERNFLRSGFCWSISEDSFVTHNNGSETNTKRYWHFTENSQKHINGTSHQRVHLAPQTKH